MVNEVSSGIMVNDDGGFNDFCTCGEFHGDLYSSVIWKCYKYMIEAMKR